MTGFVLKLQIIAWSFHLSFFLVRSIIWTCWLSERDGRKNILGSKSILPDREDKDFTPDLTKLTKILVNLTPSFFLFIFFSFFPYKFFPRLCSRHRLRPSFEIFLRWLFFPRKSARGAKRVIWWCYNSKYLRRNILHSLQNGNNLLFLSSERRKARGALEAWCMCNERSVQKLNIFLCTHWDV